MDQFFGLPPSMKGTEATVILRKAGVKAFIIGFTGDSHPEHNANARAAGQDHVLGKPFTDSNKLRKILQGLLLARAGGGGGGRRSTVPSTSNYNC